MKKGRHRRFEEARALKRSDNVDFDGLLDSLETDADADGQKEWADIADDYSQWADVAAEYEAQKDPDEPDGPTEVIEPAEVIEVIAEGANPDEAEQGSA